MNKKDFQTISTELLTLASGIMASKGPEYTVALSLIHI